jgi:UPF0176 protein
VITVAALYHFSTKPIDNLINLRDTLLTQGRKLELLGTLLIAPEGINGTIAGSETNITAMVTTIQTALDIEKLQWKRAEHPSNPFYRFKVKIKKEIVTLGQNSDAVATKTGKYIAPKDWNNIINDPNTLVIDTRNDYETKIGTFPQAIDPKTKNFRDFPDFVQKELANAKNKKIAMFCTGGIRCEKASNYLIDQGFNDVCQLHGGILQYLEDVKGEENQWQGECFVFDNRVAVDKELNKGQYDQCFACRLPITEEDKHHPAYTAGVSCHHCFDKTNPQQKKRFEQRQKQQTLAHKRGTKHIGPQASTQKLVHTDK